MSAETREFQAEVQQLLHLMIHSLYSNKEIFLRELISNAADAADKLRFEAISDESLLGDDPDLRVDLRVDKDAGTLTISDNGIGMSRDEVIENLGTIASSGTRKFLDSLTGDQKKDSQLIGQFGVGFYSSFIVAKTVTVITRRAGASEAVRWESDGSGQYTLDEAERSTRGTDVILTLGEDETDFLEPMRLRHIVSRYSAHIGLPIRMPAEDGDEMETINDGLAMWAKPKSELSDEDYTSFYTTLTHDPEPPLAWAHNRVEGNQEYTSLLYIPSRAPFDLWDRDQRQGLKLYVKRVFILDHAEALLPAYLRFVRGLVDSADLPLNVSRELLQDNRIVRSIRSALTKRVLDMIERMAKNDEASFHTLIDTYSTVLKEGIVEDPDNRERIAKLLRFTSANHSEERRLSLADYVAAMPEEQEKIYYLTAESLTAARQSPHLEGFRKRGFDVLLLTDRVDEWLVTHLTSFEDKELESVTRAGAEFEDEGTKAAREEAEKEFGGLIERLGKTFEGRVKSVRVSSRLTDSPACLVFDDDGISSNLQRILKEAGQPLPEVDPVLEVNTSHPLVRQLDAADDGARFEDLAELVYGQAVLAEGGQLEQPGDFVQRLNRVVLGGMTPTATEGASEGA